MKSIWTLAVAVALLVQPVPALCQEPARTPITYDTGFFETAYRHEGAQLKSSELVSLLEQEPKTVEKLGAAKARGGIANVVAGVAGGLIGWPLGAAIAGSEDPNWTLAYAGGGCLVIAALLAKSADRQRRDAVDIYNGDVHGSAPLTDNPVQLCMRPDGVALFISF